MKGLMIFSPLNDLSYIYSDKEFTKHVNTLAIKQGLMQEENIDDEIDPNAAVQLFSILIASQRFMISQANNAYHSIRCENNFLFVFKQFSDHIFVAVNGDDSETEEFLTRKLYILHRLVAFLYGPVLEELRPSKSTERAERWRFVNQLMNTWSHLYRNEQSFLIEAIERLHVNKILNSRCIELLESALSSIQAGGEKHVVHAILAVNSKLLALYSTRNATELNQSDILLLLLFGNALYPDSHPAPSVLSRSMLSTSSMMPSLPGGARKTPMHIRAGDSGRPYSVQEMRNSPDEETAAPTATDSSDFEFYSSPSKESSSDEEAHPEDEGKRSSNEQRSSETNPIQLADVVTSSKEPSPDSDVPPLEFQVAEPPLSPAEQTQQESMNVLEVNTEEKPSELRLSKESLAVSGENRSKSSTPQSTSSGAQGAKKRGASRSSSGGSKSSHNPPGSASRPPVSPLSPPSLAESYVFIGSEEEEEGSEDDGWRAERVGTGGDHQQYTVMLNALRGRYLPHGLHCLRILPGITLIVIKEMREIHHCFQLTQASKCAVITDTLATLRVLLMGKWKPATNTSGKQLYDYMDTNLKKLADILKKVKGSQQVERFRTDIANKWEMAKQAGVVNFLGIKKDAQMSARLESSLGSLQDRLINLFHMFFLVPQRQEPARQKVLNSAIEQVRLHLQKHLQDYQQYLYVKVQRNITITNYLDEFPGLVHFIYVNRYNNQMTAPSLAVSKSYMEDTSKDRDVNKYIKKQIWTKVGWLQSQLSDGHTNITCREGDFHYSYFMWFEDQMGNTTLAQKQFRGFETFTPPGILCNIFYNKVAAECFAIPQQRASLLCYELFCVHLGVMPTTLVVQQCRKLANRMWETMGEVNAPISLL